MTHYAKLGAIGFRWLAVAMLFYTLPSVVMALGFRGMTEVGREMPMLAFATLLHPIVAVILFVVARPLGEFVARDLE